MVQCILKLIEKLAAINLYIETSDNRTFRVSNAEPTDVIKDLKGRIQCQEGYLTSHQRLFFNGTELPDPPLLWQYNIGDPKVEFF